MPVSDPVLDPDYADLLGELRDARTPTPPALQVRLDDLLERFEPPAPRAPARRRLRRPGRLRRPAGPVLAGAAALTFLLGFGLLIAKTGPSGGSDQSASSSAAAAPAVSEPAIGGGGAGVGASTAAASAASIVTEASPAFEAQRDARTESAAVPDGTDLGPLTPATPDTGRLQHQESHLEIALRSPAAVADATGEVTRAIAGYGGHIVTVQFATPEGKEARSQIVAKVPIERMEEATTRFTGLGRLAAAQVDISDLQAQADTLEQKVAAARLQIAQFTARLAATDLTRVQRATLVERRARARARLADLNASVSRTKQSAALADLTVVLTTDDAAVVPAAASPGAGDRAREALGVLADIGVYAVWLLVVLTPFAVLAAAFLGTRRLLRRRREQRLLETA